MINRRVHTDIGDFESPTDKMAASSLNILKKFDEIHSSK